MITEAAVSGRKVRQYTSTLRQMAALLSAANVAANLPSNTNGAESEVEAAEEREFATSPNGDQMAPESDGHQRKREEGRSCAKAAPASALPRDGDVSGVGIDEIATLAKLQSYFRVRNGFAMLESQMKVKFSYLLQIMLLLAVMQLFGWTIAKFILCLCILGHSINYVGYRWFSYSPFASAFQIET